MEQCRFVAALAAVGVAVPEPIVLDLLGISLATVGLGIVGQGVWAGRRWMRAVGTMRELRAAFARA